MNDLTKKELNRWIREEFLYKYKTQPHLIPYFWRIIRFVKRDYFNLIGFHLIEQEFERIGMVWMGRYRPFLREYEYHVTKFKHEYMASHECKYMAFYTALWKAFHL